MSAAAYRADDRPVERETFYALACDPRRSVVVEACAGAGKTWMLVSRILRALLDGAQPHEILAITFTRKAAGEMRERLDDWLRAFASPTLDDAARAAALIERGLSPAEALRLAPALAVLHEHLLRGGRPVQIRTFHAWFSQLLRGAPIELLGELGLQHQMTLIEAVDAHRPAVFRRFHAAVAADLALRADHAALIDAHGRSQTRKWLEAAWARRIEIELADAAGVLASSVPPPDADAPDRSPAEDLFDVSWERRLRDLAAELGRGGGTAQAAGTALASALEQLDPRARFDATWSALFTDKGEPRKRLGTTPELAPVQDELGRLAARVQAFDASVEHGRMVRLARVLLAEYGTYKRARGLADMADLERGGLALLRDATLAGWVLERLDARVRHVLIDEFQDTSPLQWHALQAWLGAYAGAGGGASGQRPPGVFIVGDPKQSIYRFRGAEPRVFAAAREFVVDGLGGTLLACDHTRRNAPVVLAALNAVFEPAARAGEFEGFRVHTTAIGASGSAGVQRLERVLRPPRTAAVRAAEAAPWRDSLTTPRHEPEEVLRAQEAARVAEAIATLIARERIAPSDILVLSRRREPLRLAAAALRGLGVPHAAVEDAALMETPEARDLVALLDALVSPRHRLSLAQALRSPLFGASDDDLIALSQRAQDHGGAWWPALLAEGATWSPALERARTLLPRWRDAAERLPPHDLLDRIVHEGALHERLAAALPPAQRAAALDAVDAVLAQALTIDGARYATPYGLVRALKRGLVTAASPVAADAVQLLTVHGAKGLEADAVIVMDADPQPQNPETATLLVDWPVESSHPRRCAFLYAESACPPVLAGLLGAEREARRREELNALYVAMSRARRWLVFSATEPTWRLPEPTWWDRIEPLAAPFESAAAVAQPLATAALAPARVKVLPRLAPRAAAPARTDPASPDTEATRLGKAVHRALEWAAADPGAPIDWRELAEAAALAFGATSDAVDRLAQAIWHSPACARFFGGPQLRWSGGEVPVADAGETLRIDRLVLVDEPAGPTWWVLDYKLQHTPQALQAYRDQLHRYRDAVRRANPGEPVRCAFITGAGAVVEID